MLRLDLKALSQIASWALLMAKRRAFTLVELLVVIAIIGVLLGLLLPAVQKVRHAAMRLSCANNLKQLSLATGMYQDTVLYYPPGVERPADSRQRQASLFVYLLPYLEQDNLFNQWDFTDPVANWTGGPTARAATVLNVFVCPADTLRPNPQDHGNNLFAALTSYGGNGGTRSMLPETATANGIFFETGTLARPYPGQKPIRLEDISDGTSNTILFGERYHRDGNWDSWLSAPFVPPPNPPMLAIEANGFWAPTGPTAIADVTLSGWVTINYGQPAPYVPPPPLPPPLVTPPPPPIPWPDFLPFYVARLSAFGSGHTGGANFAFADGSVHFMPSTTSLTTLQALCTRAGGEVASPE
jgi:prepilin-type N-terminal cleavage/methylation domain-containing protein/prepilin-type processing-associated H-X9-DG protein